MADFPLLVEPRGQNIQSLSFNAQGWVGVIKFARKAFLEGQSGSSSDTSATLASSAPHIQVLRTICTLLKLKNKGSNNMMLNVALAALHLSSLRLGVLTFGMGWQDFLKQIVQDPENQLLENDFEGDYNSNGWMFPLLASLAISPLVLLRKVFLKDRIYGRESLFKIAQNIGIDWPQSLVGVKNILWSKLFDIALGRKTAQQALAEFFEEVSESHLDSVSEYDQMFFSWEAQVDHIEENSVSSALVDAICYE
ncbi:hypothetical protein F5890DRAFT_1552434 [Lentinula detonsa]|uniref:Uncharacterized protein n=1 Tax=Lentinula detonsa TaxID=2804962 RepID=A0AA38Q2I5_9AGAR|nr:hypothetical protein F5890DRAFT_1552434 [Lentinula detonsa]